MSELENSSVWKKVESFVRKNRNYIGGGFIVLLILLVLIILVSPKDTKTVSGSTETAVSGASGPFTQNALKFIKDDKPLTYASTNPWCYKCSNPVTYNFTVSGSTTTVVIDNLRENENKTYPKINLQYDDNSLLPMSTPVTVKKSWGGLDNKIIEMTVGNITTDNKYEITSEGVFVDYDDPSKEPFVLQKPIIESNAQYITSTTKRPTDKYSYSYKISYLSVASGPSGAIKRLESPLSDEIMTDRYKMEQNNDPVLIISSSPYTIIDKNNIIVHEIINSKVSFVNPDRISMENLKIKINGLPSLTDIKPIDRALPTLTLIEALPIQGEIKCVSSEVRYFTKYITSDIRDRSNDIKFSYKSGDISKPIPVPLSPNGYYPKINVSMPYAIDLTILQFYEIIQDSSGVWKDYLISKDRLELVGDTVTIKNCPNQQIIAKSLKATNDGFKTSLVL